MNTFSILERARDRSCTVGATPASDKQLSYLANLIDQSNDPQRELVGWGLSLANTSAVLSKKKASSIIDKIVSVNAAAAAHTAKKSEMTADEISACLGGV